MRLLLGAVLLAGCVAGCNGILGIPNAREGLADGGPRRDAPIATGADAPIGQPDAPIGQPDAPPGAPRDACVSARLTAELLPLDVFIMLDQSGSMTDPVGGGDGGPTVQKWTAVTDAIESFVGQPSTGLSVGLGYFAVPSSAVCPTSCTMDPDCGACGPCIGNLCINTEGDSCNANDYAAPSVPIAALPGNASAIMSSIAAHQPYSSTPTSAALQGALDYAETWAGDHVSHTVAVVLATDGEPTECDTTIADIDSIATSADTGARPIPTFVIGIGSDLTDLNSIAAAGGTNQAYIVDTTGDVNKQFLTALNGIRGSTALGCKYAIPAPSGGGSPDFAALSVDYTAGSGATTTLTHRTDQAGCAGGGGWYYDDNTTPNDIILCGASCDVVETDPSAAIAVVYPCN